MRKQEKAVPHQNTDGLTNGCEIAPTFPPSIGCPDTNRKSIAGSGIRIPQGVSELHGSGYSLIPCRADKKPMVSWVEYQKRQANIEELHRWSRAKPACWAIVTGRVSGVIVLDFDGPEGRKTLEERGLNPHIKTPSGGFHVYVQLPDRVTVRTTNARSDKLLGELYPGMDIRAEGGYAIAVGSNEKGKYEFLRPLVPEPWESLPYELREYLAGDPNPAKSKRLLEEALSKAVPGCRNDTGFELARSLRDSGIPYEVAHDVMREYASRVPRSNEPYTADEALASLAQAYKREPVTVTQNPKHSIQFGPDGFSLTDLGNAERLVAKHGRNLHFDVDSGKWLIWNGKRWERDETGEVDRLACGVIRGLYDVLPTLDRNASDALYAHIKKSESAPRLAAMVELASRLRGVPVRAAGLDANPWLLNCLNGTLDLHTGKLLPQAREDLITKLCPVEYSPNAKAERWERFLKEVFNGDEELIAFVKRLVGYAITGATSEQCLFILTGKGANGKSTFVETLRRVLGDYSGDTPFSTFTERRDSNTSDLAGLVGKRFVTASEGEAAQTFNEGVLKNVTGGDAVTCRFLYREFFSYTPTYKLFFCTNEVPHIRSQNYAIKRRIRVIPFRQRFYEPSDGKEPVRDSKLLEKLIAAGSGILRWAVEGCLEWQKEGLKPPAVVVQETSKLFESQDALGEFIDSECVLDAMAEIEVNELWSRYLAWCEEHGTKPTFKAVHWFSKNICGRDGIDSRRSTGGVRLLVGITLKGSQNVMSDASDANRPFSEKYHDSSFMREVLQKTPNCVTCVTNEAAETQNRSLPEEEDGFIYTDEGDWESLYEHEPKGK